MKEARKYQLEAVEAMIAASNTGGLVICATGTGKTFITGEYFRRLIGCGIMIVDELTLLAQAKKSFEEILGEEVGEIGMGIFNPQRITVATVQSLHKHRDKSQFLKWFKTIQVIIIDEIHVAINKRNIDVIDLIQPLAVFGLTATLELKKPSIRIPVTAMAGPVIFDYPMKQGIEEGHLSKGVIIRIRFTHSGSGGDWQDDYVSTISRNSTRNRCIEDLTREAVVRRHSVILFAERLAHLGLLSKSFPDINHSVMNGAQPRDIRSATCERMNKGELPLIIANKVFSKGIDIPAADVAIDATGGASLTGTVQRLGRLSRKKEGKSGFILLDIVDKSPTTDKKSTLYNRFGVNGRKRLKSLRELGLPIVNLDWNGNASEILDKAEEALRGIE